MVAKRAILIASPHQGLRGCLNDVKVMEETLSTLDFSVTKCYDTAATRTGILSALDGLAEEVCLGDVVFVYYSGHGGLIESQLSEVDDMKVSNVLRHQRYQFIVPMDYHQSTPADFRGILDIELSAILRRITDMTNNVTMLLDCCHARFMARDPGLGDKAIPRGVAAVQYDDIRQHVTWLKTSKPDWRCLNDEENTPYVSIAAAAATETAWEYQNSSNEWYGAMTEAFAKVIAECTNHRISWKSSLCRISELVNINFPGQHPCLIGPGDRYHFSLEESASDALHIRHESEATTIQAGRVSGVLEGNIYSVVNHGVKAVDAHNQIAEARVVDAAAFKATVSLKFSRPDIVKLPDNGATAFLRHSALPKWPVENLCRIKWLEGMINQSNFVRLQQPTERGFALAVFQRDLDDIVLYTKSGVEVIRVPIDASFDDQVDVRRAVDRLARAQHLLGLKSESEAEHLHHQARFEFSILEGGSVQRVIGHDGTDSIVEDTFICIILRNDGPQTVHINVFDINAIGVISQVSRRDGIELLPGSPYIIVRNRDPPVGLPIAWPKGISRTNPLEESLVFITTSSPVDLSHLATRVSENSPPHRSGSSRLEQLILSITNGFYRDGKGVEDDEGVLRYAIHRIPFTLKPRVTHGELAG